MIYNRLGQRTPGREAFNERGGNRHKDIDAYDGRGDTGEVRRYILSKVAVCCEREQTVKTWRGMSHLTCLIRHANPTSFERGHRAGF